MNQQPLMEQPKKKGVPDIVLLLDATGSMKPCIDAVTQNIAHFIDTLVNPDANGGALINDWRIRVVGYRDRDVDGQAWWVDNPFTSDAAQAKAQLAALEAKGGGDEPESLLDALYVVSQWASAAKGQQALPTQWRYRSDARRVVVIFTDASCKPTFRTSTGQEGRVDDLITLFMEKKIKCVLFAPTADCYFDLSQMDGLEWETVGSLADNPTQALKEYTSDVTRFARVMEQLAKTVSQSSIIETPLL